MKPRNYFIGFALIALAMPVPALGEIAAVLDESGTYSGMAYRTTTSGGIVRIWSSAAPTFERRPLNPTGDVLGDLAPTIVESTTADRWPFAVWSHPNGPDYDLVFSRFTGRTWTPISFVETDNSHKALEPRMVMNSTGRPYMVWYRTEPGGGAVYFSLFLESRWMTPIRVSYIGVAATSPDLDLVSDSRVNVTYNTANGPQTRTLTIPTPDSITDDIDPKIRTQITIN